MPLEEIPWHSTVTCIWISKHGYIEGNNNADALAKAKTTKN